MDVLTDLDFLLQLTLFLSCERHYLKNDIELFSTFVLLNHDYERVFSDCYFWLDIKVVLLHEFRFDRYYLVFSIFQLALIRHDEIKDALIRDNMQLVLVFFNQFD